MRKVCNVAALLLVVLSGCVKRDSAPSTAKPTTTLHTVYYSCLVPAKKMVFVAGQKSDGEAYIGLQRPDGKEYEIPFVGTGSDPVTAISASYDGYHLAVAQSKGVWSINLPSGYLPKDASGWGWLHTSDKEITALHMEYGYIQKAVYIGQADGAIKALELDTNKVNALVKIEGPVRWLAVSDNVIGLTAINTKGRIYTWLMEAGGYKEPAVTGWVLNLRSTAFALGSNRLAVVGEGFLDYAQPVKGKWEWSLGKGGMKNQTLIGFDESTLVIRQPNGKWERQTM